MQKNEPQFERDEDLAEIVTGHGRCTFLLASLLGLILLFPYANHEIFGRILLAVLYSLVMIGGAYAITRNQRALIVGVGLGSLGVVLQWTALLTNAAVFFRLA